MIISELEEKLMARLIELKKTLKDLKIKYIFSPTEFTKEFDQRDILQIRSYILGFQEASQIALKSLREVKNDSEELKEIL